MARDEKIQFRITPEKKAHLQEIADGMGVTVSTLCSVIVGQYLLQFEKVSMPIAANAVEIMTRKLEGMTREDFAGMMAAFHTPSLQTKASEGEQERADRNSLPLGDI